MLSEDQFLMLESEISEIYEKGKTNSDLLNSYMSDCSKIPVCRHILEKNEVSNKLTHFAVRSLHSLFELNYLSWTPETYDMYQNLCLQLLFSKAETLDVLSTEGFCKLYGKIFSCGFRLFPEFFLNPESIQFFFSSNFVKHNEIGLNLCTNLLYSINDVLSKLSDNERISFFKKTTLLTCFSIANSIFENSNLFQYPNLIKAALELFIACFTFDVDITQESSMIFLPRTKDWDEKLSNSPLLLSVASNFYFSNFDDSEELKKAVLDFIYYLSSIRLDHDVHVNYLNTLIPIVIQIIQSNVFSSDSKNIGRINGIILKINLSIFSNEISVIPSFKKFVSAVYHYTLQFFDPNVFISLINEFTILLNFWSNFCKMTNNLKESDDDLTKMVKKLTRISQELYDILIKLAESGIDLFQTFDMQLVFYICSFVYKIGLKNDRNFFKSIFNKFKNYQNDLYGCYNSYLTSDSSSSLFLKGYELKVAYSALMISLPVICKVNVLDEFLVGYSMVYILNFFYVSLNEITSKPKIPCQYSEGDDIYLCLITENVVTFIISQIERSSKYLERAFTSFVIIQSPIKTIEKANEFLFNRLLSIAKFYNSTNPIIEYVFESLFNFYSLRLNDITFEYITDTFLNKFLYPKMQLKPNKKENCFQTRVWFIPTRIKFHNIFGVLMSNSATFNFENFEKTKISFFFYLNDLKHRIKNADASSIPLFLYDLIGLFQYIDNSEVYSILRKFFLEILGIFQQFNENNQLILDFYVEFTSNFGNRIKGQGISEKVEVFQKNTFEDLLIFKEVIFHLNIFFDLFGKNPQNHLNELISAYNLLANLFENFSSCIGALKLYKDKIYEKFFELLIQNFDFILKNMNNIFDFNLKMQNNSLILHVFRFINAFGSEKYLFLDMFEKQPTLFIHILILISSFITSFNSNLIISNFNIEYVRTVMLIYINLVYSVLRFLLIIKKNPKYSSFLTENEKSVSDLSFIIFDNIISIFIKAPILMNVRSADTMKLFFLLNPCQGTFDRIMNTFSILINCLESNPNIAEYMYNMLRNLPNEVVVTNPQTEGNEETNQEGESN